MVLKKFVFIFTILLISSCVSNNLNTNASLPEWYVNPPKNDSGSLYGVGEGYNIDNATKVALKNLSSKLMVTISSKSELTRNETNVDYAEESDSKIKEEVPNLTFNNYETSKSEYKNGIIYALIAVDRQQFISDNINELNKMNVRIENLDSNSKNKHILLRRQALMQINQLAKEAEKITRILGSLTQNIDSNRNINKYNEYRKEFDIVNDKIVFYIRSSKTPDDIVEVVKNQINSEGIKIVNNTSETNTNNLTILDITTSSITKEIYGTINAKVNIYFSLKDAQNKILASKQTEVSGSSVISNEQAVKSASVELQKLLEKDGIIEFIQNN